MAVCHVGAGRHIPATGEQAPSMPGGEGERELALFESLNTQVPALAVTTPILAT